MAADLVEAEDLVGIAVLTGQEGSDLLRVRLESDDLSYGGAVHDSSAP
jgi:hypothetical protein